MTFPLIDPLLIVIVRIGKDIRILERDPTKTGWDLIVDDIASGQIDNDIVAIMLCSSERGRCDVLPDIMADVHEQLRLNGNGCPSRLRDLIDEHVGLNEADKLDARAGLVEA